MAGLEEFVKYKDKIVNAGIIAAALVIAFNIYNDNLVKLKFLKLKVSEEKNKNVELDKISALEKKIAAYKRLLVNREASAVMNDINAIAKVTQARVLSVKPGQRESRADYIKDNFEVNVSAADYDGLARFINTVETYNNFYIVSSVDITSQPGPKETGLTANLRISSIIAKSQE